MSVRSFAASPKGKRIGVIAASAGRAQVLIHVTPKSFDAAGKRDVPLLSWSDRGVTYIALAETQRLHVYDEDARAFMGEIVRRLSIKAQGNRGSGGTESLLVETSTPVAFQEQPDDVTAEENPSEARVIDLLDLLDRVGFLDLDSDAVDGAVRYAPLLRPLLVRRFLDEVARRIPQARRGYRTVTERRGVVRGRVNSRSLVELRTTGVPRVTCTYDELTESTDLLRVLCTALEAVADGRGRSSAFPGRYAESALRHDAVVHRRALQAVETVPARSAIAIGRQLRLSRLDQSWATALRLACQIIAGIEAEPADSGADLDAAEISVETEKIWERILTSALRRVEPDVRTPKKAFRGRSDGAGSSPEVVKMWTLRPEPDNVVVREADMLVFDAKYKRFKGIPDRDDQYQMFAYSYLVGRKGHPTTALALVYPTNESAPPADDSEANEGERSLIAASDGDPHWERGRIDADGSTDEPMLHALKLRFPGAADLKRGAWNSYLDEVAERLGRFISGQRHPVSAEERSADTN